ncbi:MAG: hypothetical protein K1Y02_20845 [Candidatus Hydrogenedentes bacterium]|nr:hypothetical protein [Candidatus Hydrogenedentota bacterium]
MRIVSDFKDYYDSALSFGSDPSLLYVRKQERFEFERSSSIVEERKAHLPRNLDEVLRVPLQLLTQMPHTIARPRRRYVYDDLEIPVTVKLIGFCGFLFPALEIDNTVFWSTEEIADGLSREYLKAFSLDSEGLMTLLGVNYRWNRYGTSGPLTHGSWAKCVAGIVEKCFDEVFIQLGIPIFRLEYVASNRHQCRDRIICTLNPHLKQDHFQRVKPPAEAFQEISMYLGNQLATQKDPIPVVSDEIMRDEKGFDEWSFRRHKEESKKYRKRGQ